MNEQKMKMLTVLIPEELHTAVKVEASRNGDKLKEYIAKVLQEEIDKVNGKRN